MNLISMKKSDSDKHDKMSEAEAPEYPYGLSLSLDKDALEKLGVKELPQVGEKMMLMAKVEVSAVSSYDSSDGKDLNASLQITDMAIKKEDKRSLAEKMYGAENDA